MVGCRASPPLAYAFLAVRLAVVFFAVVLRALVLAGAFFAVVFLAAVLRVGVDFVAPARPVARDAALPATLAAALGSFFAPLTTSLNPWPALNFGTDVFLIFTVSPVRGLRPVRAGRATF